MNFTMFFTLLIFLAFKPDKSLQQDPILSIEPERAITNGKVAIVCRNPVGDSGAVFFSLVRVKLSSEEVPVVKLDVTCASGQQSKRWTVPDFGGTIVHDRCNSITISDIPATREMAGNYLCNVQHIKLDFTSKSFKSPQIELTVGDSTPPARMEMAIAATGVPVPADSGVAAGTNLSVACETPPAIPAPAFTVTTEGATLSTFKLAGASDSRVVAFVLLPKQPRLTFSCKAYNGFGKEQLAEVSVTINYYAIHSDVQTPAEITFQTTDEVKICSVVNHPSRPLTVKDLDSNLLQPGYPRYEESLGESRAYVKLKETGNTIKDYELTYQCGIDDRENPVMVKATVRIAGLKPGATPESSTIASSTTRSNSSNAVNSQLSTPSSAMMTAGIAVAVGAALVIVVGIAVAVIMKRRKSGDKAGSSGDNTGYGKVNQNDADHIYETNPATKSIRVEDFRATEYEA